MIPKLSKRHLEVLEWVQRGSSNKQIANRMEIEESTVKMHVSQIMKKYGVKTRMQLALFSLQGKTVELVMPEIEQTPIAWVSLINNVVVGFSLKSIDGWSPVYLKANK